MQRIFRSPSAVVFSADSECLLVLSKLLEPYCPAQSVTTDSQFDVVLNRPELPTLTIVDLDLHGDKFLSALREKPVLPHQTSFIGIGKSPSRELLRQSYELGLQDYISKPINETEFEVKADAAMKPWVRFMKFSFEFVQSLGAELTLTEQKLLHCFLKDNEHFVRRDEVTQLLWGETKVHPNTLDVHLFNLRKKINGSGVKIISSRKVGAWKLVPETEVEG